MDRYKDILNSIESNLSQSARKPINTHDERDDFNPPTTKTSILNNMDDDIPNPIDEDVMEGKCRSDEENESYSMIIAYLKNIMSNADAIINNSELDKVKENLTEPWILGMIAVVNENISKIHDFVKFNEPDDDEMSDASGKTGLWDNIRKKKEKEGKNYKPAKPGDKDRPDPEMWKKLTK